MSILDIFKKKKPVKATKEEIKPIVQKEIPKPKKNIGAVFNIVKEPHISEKSTNLGVQNQYVFDVFPKANKIEIKKAIEGMYGVNVLSVNIINVPGKKRRMGRTIGFKKGYKKAIVTIKQGQKIEIL